MANSPDMASAINVLIHESQFPDVLERELKDSLNHRSIRPKFHYLSHRQTQAWLALHQACAPSASNPDCLEIYDRAFQWVTEHLPPSSIHLVSLGCGAAQKEARLLNRLNPSRHPTRVTLVDASPGLLIHAHRNLTHVVKPGAQTSSSASPSEAIPRQVTINALAADLTVAKNLESHWAGKSDPAEIRLITCFGVLPNVRPKDILRLLRRSLRPGDFLLLSANLAPTTEAQIRNHHEPCGTSEIVTRQVQALLPQYDNSLTRDWLRQFLLDCGFERDDGQILFTVEPCPDWPQLPQIVAHFHLRHVRKIPFGDETISFQSGDIIRLFYSNRYSENLVQLLLAEHGLESRHNWTTQPKEEGVFACGLKPD